MERDDWVGVGLVLAVWLLLMAAMVSQLSVVRTETILDPPKDPCVCTCDCEEK